MEKDKWLSTVSSVLGVPLDKLTELDELDDSEAAKGVKELGKALITKTRDEGHGKGLKKGTEALRKLKAEFSLDLADDELDADKIVTAVREKVEEEAGESLTEDAVKQTPAYKELSAELVKEKQQRDKLVQKEVKTKLTEKEKEFETKLKEAQVKSLEPQFERAAEEWLTEMKAVLPEDKTKRSKVIKELAGKLKAYKVEPDEDGDFLITKADGSAFLNASGHNGGLTDVFAEYDYLFTFQQTQQRGSSGIDPKNQGGQAPPQFQHFKGEVPKTEAEMQQLTTDRANRRISAEAYTEAKAAYTAANQK